jgi:uncharacterized membrane protein
MPVALTYTPHEPGEHKLTLRLESADGELITKNNEASTFVTVREGGIQVLFLTGAKRIGGTPGQEQRFVRASLAESPDIVVTRRVFDYRQPREDIRELIDRPAFDAVVLDDVDSLALNNESWQALAKRVSEGMGLMMLGGYHSFGPGGYRDAPLGEALPVGIGPAERQNFDEPVRSDMHLKGPLAIRPTQPLGAQHSILQIHAEDQSSPGWSELPPLDGANRLDSARLKPNAAVLLESDGGEPILVAGQYGEGRTLAFAGDSTWRWVMQGFGEPHRRFWRQAILWLARKDAQTEGDVWVRLEGRQITRGARVDFQFGHSNIPLPPGDNSDSPPLGGEGLGEGGIQFTTTIITPDGTHKTINSSKDGDAFRATFRDTQLPGDYTIEVVARRGDAEVGKAQARFLVPDRDLELEQPAAEPGLMAQLARMTAQAGGKPMAAEELPGLLAQLAAQPPEIKKEVLSRITYWDTWPFFLTFVGLLGTEWYLRKRWGLV